MKSLNLFLLFFVSLHLQAQHPSIELANLEKALAANQTEQKALTQQIITAKEKIFHQDLVEKGLPAISEQETIVHHSMMSLVYSEAHEQAKWVAHIISPDILTGVVARSNDFRVDPKIATGTAIEEDYFLRIKDKNGNPAYDGFGWDRGHLAPSADFRWSANALSESYFYSNMSPQVPDFNRKSWAELENELRAYVYRNKVPLYVVTGGVLTDDLPVIERGIHQVSIPQQFWKVVVDLDNQRGIAFLMPNTLNEYPIEHYAVTIDEIESTTGIDFYADLADELEGQLEMQKNTADWFTDVALGDVEPIALHLLPKKHYNTILGKRQAGNNKAVHICGTVVRSRTTRKGNVMFNLDKAYPNELFNVFINKDNLINFPNNPVTDYLDQQICVYGEVGKIGNVPTVYIDGGKQVKVIRQKVTP